jgi:S-adenosylmethionine-diacylglycerol 3-amino-3-carboxypropyl transferase
MKVNSLQFAITREDPQLELEIIRRYQVDEVLLVCSGGDTVFAVKSAAPAVKITAFDFNPTQIAHFQRKAHSPISELNQEPIGVCQIGNFESLFRQWRSFIHEFVAGPEFLQSCLVSASSDQIKNITTHAYWPVSFDLFFHDSLLRAMFTERAIQHAPQGSYPRYFQQAFERGLASNGFNQNPFLQHLLTGEFSDLPTYLAQRPDVSNVELVTGSIHEVQDLSRFGLIQLSNIFDWSTPEEIRSTCQLLATGMRPGSILLLRQINNDVPLEDFLGPTFQIDHHLGQSLLAKDRSLFYSRIIVAIKGD